MLSQRKTPQGGFTLIELVVVIVILGILAAFAIPRFANIARDARISALNGLAGSLRSTSALVHGMALAQNQAGTAGVVQLEGAFIGLSNGYPTAAGPTASTTLAAPGGVLDALNNLDPATYTVTLIATTPPSARIDVSGAATPASCSVTYTEAASANSPATIVVSATASTAC